MSTPIAIYLIPLYIILLCVLINYIAIRASSTLRARLSTSSKSRYLIPYPLILIGLPAAPIDGHSGNNNNNTSNARQTAQRPQSSGITGWLQGQARRGTYTSSSSATAAGGAGGAGVGGGEDPLTDLMARNLGLSRPGRAPTVTPSTRPNPRPTNPRPTGTPTPATTTTTPATSTTTTPRTTTGRVITRGGRRWGRTGSQRSTQTLPLYEEDVGEEDVVLIRKRESLREAGRGDERDIAENQMEDVDDDDAEEGDDDPASEEDVERRTTLLPGQTLNSSSSSTSTPNDVTADDAQTQTRTRASSVSTSDIPDRGWGEAPSYDVAVPPPRFDFDLDAESRPAGPIVGGSGSGAGNGGGGGFRAFVGRLTGGRAEQHRRGYSSGSAGPDDDRAGLMRMSTAGTVMTMGRNRGWSNASSVGAGRNVSGSTTPGMMSQVSLVSNPAGQTMSRFSSRLSSFGGAGTGGGNTPTLTSANSSVTNLNPSGPISAPLPGSLIRSSFDAPRAGFSAKQVEFLSSTESLGKYGVRVDEDGNPIPITNAAGRVRGSSVGSMSMSLARPSVDEGNGTGWRTLAREERAAGNVPAPLSIQVPSMVPGGELEIEVVPPTPVLTT